MIAYRKEIDGLRAIAVLPVILFHAGFSIFSGGFVGVDVFFVISGYLITSIIIHDIEQQKFSLIQFYERRARRILPALTFVLIFTTFAAYILMPAYLLKLYSQSLVAVGSFLSNVYFYLTSGYFSTAAEEKPLLHTWSLAVEEQYYVFYPLLLAAFWAKGKRFIILCLVVLSIASLTLAQLLAEKQLVDANFYLIFSRAWELLLGSLIAFIPFHEKVTEKRTQEFLSIIGLLMVMYAIFAYDKYTPFPSIYTLVPVVGTCLIIAFTKANSLVGKLLSTKFMVGIGLISYSLYLWHQPLLAFLRLKSVGEPKISLILGAIAATFLAAAVSWKYVETPFRDRKRFPQKRIFVLSIFSLVACLFIGGIGHLGNGFGERFSEQQYQDSMVWSPKRNCHQKGPDASSAAQACTYFGENVTWAVFGDSHVVEPAYALAKNLQSSNVGLQHFSFKGCMPALSFSAIKPGCSEWIRETLDYIESQAQLKNVFLAFRHSYYLYGPQTLVYPDVPNESFKAKLYESHKYSDEQHAREAYWSSFKEMIERLHRAGKTVYVLFPIPELPLSMQKAVAPFSILSDKPLLPLNESTSVTYYKQRHRFILDKLESYPFNERIVAIKPLDIICNEAFCPAVKNEKALYYDDNHLSLSGAQMIADALIDSATGEVIE